MSYRYRYAGVTIIELLVVIAIVGILFAIAIPAYSGYTLRSGRADGKAKLLEIASWQERHYSAENTYLAQSNILSNDGKYSISIAACASATLASCFVATAVPQSAQVNDECGNLTLTNTGIRTAAGGTVQQCWLK